MYKKILLIALLLFYAPAAFAVDKSGLGLDFFDKFNDDCLVYYINLALENNHDAKQATQTVEQYRQEVKYSFGQELPSFGVSANYLGIKVPKLDNFQLKKNAFVLPFTANYEADFLLKNRDKTKSAKKSYEAQIYDEKAVYIALLSDTAAVYTNILQYDELIKLAAENVDIYTKLLDADIKKYERGVINSTQFNNSRKNLETAKNTLENIEKEREILLMQLAVLTGISPDEISALKRGSLENFEYTGAIPDYIESDVIYSRPDVMSAEARLEKAKIDIRVARKDFLPTFNITGIWAFNTIAPGTFFSWESSLAAILAGASQDIFTGGRKIAKLKLQKAKYEELFENYRQTDLNAVKEVNTALCLIKYDTEINKNTLEKLNYEFQNLTFAKRKSDRGIISQPEYLSAQSDFINAQNDAVNAKTQRLINYFTLYKAVGGKL